MARLGYDEIDTIRDSIHSGIIGIGFGNARISAGIKGDAFFSFDTNELDTSFVWVYEGTKMAKKKSKLGNLEAGMDGFRKLVSAVRNEYGSPTDSLVVGTMFKDILVHWNTFGFETEILYSLDTGYPGLNLQCHLSRWELPKPDTSPITFRIDYNASKPTPLVEAIISRNTNEIKRLLDGGANPNEFSSSGVSVHGKAIDIATPLSRAASDEKECDTQIIKLLIDHGGDPNLIIQGPAITFSPLNSAIERGCIANVIFLLRHGANPNAVEWIGKRTPLLLAIVFRSKLRDDRKLELDREMFGDTTQASRMRVYDSIISILLKNGASPTLADPYGTTPLHAAAEHCDSALAEELISLGASLTAKDKDGNTPEDVAKKNNCPSVLAFIQRHKNSTK